MKKENIIKAGVLGDAFGYNVEFQSWENIRITYGGPILFSNCNNFIASDDTQMTLFCLEALKENHQFNNDNENIIKRIYDYYLEWNATQYSDLIFKKEHELFLINQLDADFYKNNDSVPHGIEIYEKNSYARLAHIFEEKFNISPIKNKLKKI